MSWKRPKWSQSRTEQYEAKDPYDLEEKDAARTGGQVHPRSGAGPFKKLDSSNEFFATDNKLTKKKSYSLKRDFWFERRAMARKQKKSFREQITFVDEEKVLGHPERELNLVVIEQSMFESMLEGLLEGY